MNISFTYIFSPFLAYESIKSNSSRLALIRNLTEFEVDIAAGSIPQYINIFPNSRNNGRNTNLDYAANWTATFLSPLLEDESFMERTLILLTYDESATYSKPNTVMSLLLGGIVPVDQKGTSDPRYYSPYSIISTVESNWELPCLGRFDVGANVFEFVTYDTDYTNHAPSNMKTVDNSISYRGFLNDDPTLFIPIPPPNLQLVGAGGFGVHESTYNIWKTQANELTPYDGTNRAKDGGSNEKNAVIYQPQGPAPPKYAVTLKTSNIESAGEDNEAFIGEDISNLTVPEQFDRNTDREANGGKIANDVSGSSSKHISVQVITVLSNYLAWIVLILLGVGLFLTWNYSGHALSKPQDAKYSSVEGEGYRDIEATVTERHK